jgi:hypothetical protein
VSDEEIQRFEEAAKEVDQLEEKPKEVFNKNAKDLEEEKEIEVDDVAKAVRSGDPSGLDLSRRWRRMRRNLRRLPGAMRKLMADNVRLLEMLMPGVKARTSSVIYLPLIVFLGLGWITYWVHFLYKQDHEEHLIKPRSDEMDDFQTETSMDYVLVDGRWTPSTRTTSAHVSGTDSWETGKQAERFEKFEERKNALHIHADVVIVFHHPSFEYRDREQRVSVDMLERLVTHSHLKEHSAGGFFKDLESVIQEHEEEMRHLTKSQRAMANLKDGVKSAVGAQEAKMTMGEARVCVLKDMVRSLPLLGFQVDLFSSCDDDELFLCISLNRPEVQKHYLFRENISLQTTHQVVKSLHIAQDPYDPCSSPPFLLYDHRLVQALHKAHVLPKDDDRELYRVYHDRDSQGSVMSSRERIRIIQREVTRFLDVEAAKDIGILIEWYPAHSELWLRKLRATWSSKERIKDFSFVQPVPLLREYYGSQLAFSFAWQGCWCKGLICLSVLALLVGLIKTAPLATGFFEPGEEPVKERQIMPFAILTLIWARVMTNLWLREEEYFTRLWNINGAIEDRIVRPGFKGKMVKSLVDANILEAEAPRNEQILRQIASVSVTLICCVFTMATIGAWVHMHEGDLDIPASICLSALVKMFEFLYNAVAARLIIFENHKYDQDLHNRMVWMQFLFQAVNSYWACVSVAFSQKVAGHCPEDMGCFGSLQHQLGLLIIILLACGVAFSILEYILVWIGIKMEDWAMDKEERDVVHLNRSFLEEQSKYSVYGMREQVENMLQLVLGLGFVLLFGIVQPWVVPLCFIHFWILLRARAWLLTEYSKRCLPHKLIGIGAWKEVMNCLMNVSVFVNGVLITYWGRFFKGALLLAKLSGLVTWILLIYALWSLVDVIVPPKSEEAVVLASRRVYSARVINEVSMDSKVGRQAAAQQDDVLFEAAEGSVSSQAFQESHSEDEEDFEAKGHHGTRSEPLQKASAAQRAMDHARNEVKRRISGKKVSRTNPKLTEMDAVSHRSVTLQLDCQLDELALQADIVNSEMWDEIPRMTARTQREIMASPRVQRKIMAERRASKLYS